LNICWRALPFISIVSENAGKTYRKCLEKEEPLIGYDWVLKSNISFMKHAFLLSIAILLVSFVFGQMTPESYLSSVLDVPAEVCGMNDNQYLDKVRELSDRLEEDIDQLKQQSDENAEKYGDEISAGTLRNAGFEGADAQQVKGAEDMTDAEVEALADKMMQQGMNISMSELKDLDKLDTAGQKAWAEGVATEQMANAEAAPQAKNEQQVKTKLIYDLAAKQKFLMDKRLAGELKFSQQFDSLDHDAGKARKKLDIELEPLYKALETASEDQAIGIHQKIRELQDHYCQAFSPRYLEILASYKEYVVNALPDIKQQESVQNQLVKAQSGVDQPLVLPNQLCFDEVKAYFFRLGNILKYKF
jgi:hypothetical protein